jgi:hypothetical protein
MRNLRFDLSRMTCLLLSSVMVFSSASMYYPSRSMAISDDYDLQESPKEVGNEWENLYQRYIGGQDFERVSDIEFSELIVRFTNAISLWKLQFDKTKRNGPSDVYYGVAMGVHFGSIEGFRSDTEIELNNVIRNFNSLDIETRLKVVSALIRKNQAAYSFFVYNPHMLIPLIYRNPWNDYFRVGQAANLYIDVIDNLSGRDEIIDLLRRSFSIQARQFFSPAGLGKNNEYSLVQLWANTKLNLILGTGRKSDDHIKTIFAMLSNEVLSNDKNFEKPEIANGSGIRTLETTLFLATLGYLLENADKDRKALLEKAINNTAVVGDFIIASLGFKNRAFVEGYGGPKLEDVAKVLSDFSHKVLGNLETPPNFNLAEKSKKYLATVAEHLSNNDKALAAISSTAKESLREKMTLLNDTNAQRFIAKVLFLFGSGMMALTAFKAIESLTINLPNTATIFNIGLTNRIMLGTSMLMLIVGGLLKLDVVFNRQGNFGTRNFISVSSSAITRSIGVSTFANELRSFYSSFFTKLQNPVLQTFYFCRQI